MTDPAFHSKLRRVAEQAAVVRDVLNRSNRDDVQIDFEKLGAALDVAEELTGAFAAQDVRKAVKAVHQELLDAYDANLGEAGDPELLQLDPALEILIARLTAVADSGEPDWSELGPDTPGQVIESAPYAPQLQRIVQGHNEVIEKLEALETQVAQVRENQDAVQFSASLGLLSVSRSVTTAKLKELVERMLLSGERLSQSRLAAASQEVGYALDAFEAAIEEDEQALARTEGLREQAGSTLALARKVSQQVRSFLRQVFGPRIEVTATGKPDDPWPPGKVFRDAEFAPEMVVIPGGTFLMGSPEDETERDDDEGPQHEVTVPRFALGIYAVTFAEYDHFCEATGRGKPDDRRWGRADRPVIDVSWKDAVAYCEWLSAETETDYRLPSEAEWEYACRAGTTTPFWWGETITPAQANYQGIIAYNGGETGEYREQTVPVRSFEPNPFGLYQMHGNVLEWVQDNWHENYEGAPSDGSVWAAGAGGIKVLRGGSWFNYPQDLRSAYRSRFNPDNLFDSTGFRVARTLTP